MSPISHVDEMRNYKATIANSTARARTHVAQIASVRYTLQTIKDSIVGPCARHYVCNPNDVRFGCDNLTKEIQNLFKDFKSFYDQHEPDYTPGHLFNMSVVLTIDAVLQRYLDEVFDVFLEARKWDEETLKDATDWKEGKLKRSVNSKLRSLFGEKGLIKQNAVVETKDSIKFLEQLRHMVTHCGGIVDNDFYLHCGVNPTSKKLDDSKRRLILSNLPESIDERDVDSFCSYFVIGDQVGLPIEKLVRLEKEAVSFIGDIHDICIAEKDINQSS